MAPQLARLMQSDSPWAQFAGTAAGVTDPSVMGDAGRQSVLLQRAKTLPGVSVGGSVLAGFSGASLRLAASDAGSHDPCFIRGRVFAVVGPDGSLCLRLPRAIAEDLTDNALGMQAGKNTLTWPPQSDYQLETQWRILQQAYWNATGMAGRKGRRLWSEWVVNH